MRNFASSYCLCFTLSGVVFWLAPPHLFAQTKQQVYDSINARRIKAGLTAIPIDKKLERSAQTWAVFMPYDLKHNTKFLVRFNRTGAECITIGADPVKTWMKSKPHRQCIMGRSVKAMGVGYWRGKWVWRSFSN